MHRVLVRRRTWKFVGIKVRALLRFVPGYARFWSFYSSAGCPWVAELSPFSASVSSGSWNSERSKVEEKTLGRLDNLSSDECFFVWPLAPLKINDHVTVTMIRFSTRIKSLHIWGIFSSRVWRRFDKLACALKSLFGLCLFIHDGASTSNKELDGFNNSFWH